MTMHNHDHLTDFVKMFIGTVSSAFFYFTSKFNIIETPMFLNDFNDVIKMISPSLSALAAILTISLGIKNLFFSKKKKNEPRSD